MDFDRQLASVAELHAEPAATGIAPGKRTRVEARYGRGGGQRLPSTLEARFAAALGRDLSGVRVHTDDDAARAAAALGARAFAEDQDIIFGAGEYRPGTADGDHLIAHEVAHTAQQAAGSATIAAKRTISEPGDAAEVAADRAADAMVRGAPVRDLGPAPIGRYRTANQPLGLQPEAPVARLEQLSSTHWEFVELLHQPLPDPGTGGTFDGTFVRSRFRAEARVPSGPDGRATPMGGVRPAAIPRDSSGQLHLDPDQLGGDVGAMPRFIENHPVVAARWGFRLEHNADGLVTHLITPTPATFQRLRANLQTSPDPVLAPVANPQAVDHNVGNAEFAQTLRNGTPPVSVIDPALYYHDWLQHMPGMLTLGRRTAGYLRGVAAMVADCYQVAGQRAAAEGNPPELVQALRTAVDRIAGNGRVPETHITRIGELMAAPTAALDRAALTGHYRHLWDDRSLAEEPTTTGRAALSPMQQASFDRAIAAVIASRDVAAARLRALAATRDAQIAADLDDATAQLARGDAIAAEASFTFAGHTLSVHDPRQLAIAVEGLVEAGQYSAALAAATAERDRARGVVEGAQRRGRAVETSGSEASGVAAFDDNERAQAARQGGLDQLIPAMQRAAAAVDEPARVAYLHRFEDIGLRMVTRLFAAHERRASQPATGRSPRAEEQLDRAELDAARAALGVDFIWTDATLIAALGHAVELDRHPIRRRWIEAERQRRQPPPRSSTLRNVLLGSLITLSWVTGTLLVAEALEGAGVAATAVFSLGEASAVRTGVRVVLSATQVTAALESLAVEAGIADVVTTAAAVIR